MTITLRDLQWRARRFSLGVTATALVFSMTLVLAGLVHGFQSEVQRTIDTFKGDRWVVLRGVSGPFTAASPVPESARRRLLTTPGVKSAEPVVILRHTARDGSQSHPVNVIAGQPVQPRITAGRAVQRDGEAVADDRSGIGLGDTITLGGLTLHVVGRTTGLSYFAGTPVLVLSLDDGRRLAYGGAPLATAIITRGAPAGAAPGLKVMDVPAVKRDLRKPVAGATTTIAILALILAFIAMGIIGLMTYLSGLDRLVDFAVFKAIGVRTGKLLTGLVLQVVLLAVTSALIASAIALLIAPLFPLAVELPFLTFAGLLALAIVVGLLVSVVNIRQATRVDPALAFGRN